MASAPLENSLNDLFVKSAPALPAGGKKFLVEWAPWLALIAGLLSLWGAFGLWHWARYANQLVDYANSLSAAYGVAPVATSRWTAGVWLALIVVTVQAILMIAAFSGLKARKKNGWNLLYYSMLLNVVYGAVLMFTNYGGVGNLLGALIGSAIGMYFLFQIRSSYIGHKPAAHSDDAPKA